MALGYCIVCKATRELRDVKQIQRSGLPTIEGKCTVCNTETFVLGEELNPAARTDQQQHKSGP
jgi:hypothetical protein